MNAAPPPQSIRRRLTKQILAGTLALLLGAGAIFLGVIHRQLVRDFDGVLETEAAALAHNAEIKGHTLVWDLPAIYSAGSRESSGPAFCQLFLEDGTVAGLSQTLGTENLPRAGRDGSWNAPLPDGSRGRLVQLTFRPAIDNTETQTAPDDPREQMFEIPATTNPAGVKLVLVVARSRTRLDALLGSLHLAGAVAAVGVSFALALLVRRAIAHGLRPIEEINAQIAAITPDVLASRLKVSAPPAELAAVESAVNHLLDRVEKAFERERRFSSDLAHELRTPLAELRAACEVGERWPDDAESTRQFFADTRAIALQLEKIVASLLTLARSEEGAACGPGRRIHLQALVRECWRHNAAAAAGRRLRFDERIGEALTVESDEDKLGMVVRNLLDNAVAHGERGTVVGCDAGATPEGVELRFTNTAGNLERADLEHVFDRFWRKDPARTGGDHAGLGLSIARALCGTLGLRLDVALREGRLFEARILFPKTAR